MLTSPLSSSPCPSFSACLEYCRCHSFLPYLALYTHLSLNLKSSQFISEGQCILLNITANMPELAKRSVSFVAPGPVWCWQPKINMLLYFSFSLKQSGNIWYGIRYNLEIPALAGKIPVFETFQDWLWPNQHSHCCIGAVNADWAPFPKRWFLSVLLSLPILPHC